MQIGFNKNAINNWLDLRHSSNILHAMAFVVLMHCVIIHFIMIFLLLI